MENIAKKIERVRFNLYTIKGSLVSPEVVRVSQELDKHIVAFQKQQAIWFREERQPVNK